MKLEVHFIGNPRPEVIWTREGEELVNSRHVQVLHQNVGLCTRILFCADSASAQNPSKIAK